MNLKLNLRDSRRLGWMAAVALLGLFGLGRTVLCAAEAVQPAGTLPVVAEVDVIVVGGSAAGVTAAVTAAGQGARVFLAAPRPYLGEDICGTYRLWLEPGETPTVPLARELFGTDASPLQPVKPMQVKRALDQALLQAHVPFLYASYVTELLRDPKGRLAGVVIANKSARQAVLGRVIIDATQRAQVARMAGAKFSPYPAGVQTFSRIVVGGEPRGGEGVRCLSVQRPLTILAPAVPQARREAGPAQVLQYELSIPMRDGSYAAFAEAEQVARERTWSREALDGSEMLFQVPPDALQSREPYRQPWRDAEQIPLGALVSDGAPGVFVLGGCVDVPREVAARLSRPVHLMALGARVGTAAAALAKTLPVPRDPRVPGTKPTQAVAGEVREVGVEFSARTYQRFVPEEAHGLPVLGEYDVVVVGGGTGGAPAGIAAGRQGAKTLLVEYQAGFGGVGTLGYISVYYHGNCVGFTAEVTDGLARISPRENRAGSAQWNPDHKSEWWRRELRKAGVEIWTGVLGCGALVESGRVKGVVVATPQGRGVVLAKVVVDSTGNSDIAAAAGATCRYTDGTELAVQGSGLPARNLGQRYSNTDWTFVDETDITDIWRAFVMARAKFPDAYDLGTFLDTRERRQIVGDFVLSPLDEWLGRTYSDTVVITKSDLDTHGYTTHPLYSLRPPDKRELRVRVPWRCLLPRGLDGILVTGLSVSAHRDALPFIRMQGDVQNQGYAVGLAAAMIARRGCGTRELDFRALQKLLVEKGNLPPSVLTEQESPPLSRERVGEAVQRLTNNLEQLEVVLAQWETAQPLVRQAFATASAESNRLTYAEVLGMMGDAAGAETLAQAVTAQKNWDKGWEFKGMGQYGANKSLLDLYIVALGRSRSPLALTPILAKAQLLVPTSEFSHFRAIGLAAEALADPAAAKPLADLLRLPGVSGHAVTNIQDGLTNANNPPGGVENRVRDRALREIYLARALYRCGDYEGMAEKILRAYSADLHAHYARHAQAVLKERAKQSSSIPDGKPHRFELRGGRFLLDDQPFRIVAGEMHLPRVVPEFWEQRIRQARAMGLNTVSLYVMWNQIEPREGQFNFEGFNDVRRVVQLCQTNGMWVVLRPGPYVCAEFEFGGLPAWLLTKGCDMRKFDPVKLKYDRRYIQKLGEQLADLQVQRGGPILMVQVENEHRSIDDYMRELTKYYREAGFQGQLFTCDPGLKTFDPEEGIPGVLRGVNGVMNDQKLYERVKYLADKQGFPVYSAEVYTAWYSHWGKKINRRPVSSELKNAKWLLDRNISWSYYMFFGGTTFGFQNMDTAITSYDYDAPIDEAGRVTPKYRALREFFTRELNISPPPIPPDPVMLEIPTITLSRQCGVLDALPKPAAVAQDVRTMEQLGQAYGFVLYRKQFAQGINGVLDVSKARDYALILVNGQPVGRAFAKYGRQTFQVPLHQAGPATLDILVYNLGRTRATKDETKGLAANPTLDGKPLQGWSMFSLPLENPCNLPQVAAASRGPTFYRGSFNLDKVGETFLDLRHWGFGVVWVNGHNLGRYWDVGAARSLYLPSPWQRKGANEIVILELQDAAPKAPQVSGTTRLIEEEPVPFPEDLKEKKS